MPGDSRVVFRINRPDWKLVHNRRARVQEELPPNCVKAFVIGPNFYAMLRRDQLENTNTQGSRDRTDDTNGTPVEHVRDSRKVKTISKPKRLF